MFYSILKANAIMISAAAAKAFRFLSYSFILLVSTEQAKQLHSCIFELTSHPPRDDDERGEFWARKN